MVILDGLKYRHEGSRLLHQTIENFGGHRILDLDFRLHAAPFP